MSNARRIYDDMWQNSLKQFQAGDFEIDPLIRSGSDTRMGLTVLSRISGEVARNITHFLEHLEAVEPDQYFYPSTDLHLTILSVIACYEGFTLSDVDPDAYIRTVRESLANIEPFQVEFRGITASPSCILVQGFPVGNKLARLRDNLRHEFKQTTLQTSIDSRYTIATAHATVARFQVPVTHSAALMELLSEYRDHPFGTLEIDSLELVLNDWYQRAAATRRLFNYDL